MWKTTYLTTLIILDRWNGAEMGRQLTHIQHLFTISRYWLGNCKAKIKKKSCKVARTENIFLNPLTVTLVFIHGLLTICKDENTILDLLPAKGPII